MVSASLLSWFFGKLVNHFQGSNQDFAVSSQPRNALYIYICAAGSGNRYQFYVVVSMHMITYWYEMTDSSACIAGIPEPKFCRLILPTTFTLISLCRIRNRSICFATKIFDHMFGVSYFHFCPVKLTNERHIHDNSVSDTVA